MHRFGAKHKMLCGENSQEPESPDFDARQHPASESEAYSGWMHCESLIAAGLDDNLTDLDCRILLLIAGGLQKRADIAAKAKCAVNSVPRSLKRLEEHGYVLWTKGGGRGRSSSVTVLPRENRNPEVIQHPKIGSSTVIDNPGVTVTVLNRHPEVTVSCGEVLPPVDKCALARAETLTFINTSTSSSSSDRSESRGNSGSEVIHILNGSAAGMPAHQLAEIIVDHVNSHFLNPNRSQQLVTSTGRIKAWQNAGADFDADILPTIFKRMAGRTEPVHTWGYFDNAVRKACAQRKAAEAPMEAITAGEARDHEQRSDTKLRRDPRAKRNLSTQVLDRFCADD